MLWIDGKENTETKVRMKEGLSERMREWRVKKLEEMRN